MSKKRIMESFVIDEIAGVDRPAQEGALTVIMKRDDSGDEDITKRLVLLSSVKGHAHLLDDMAEGGHTSHEKAKGAEFGHSHPWARDEKGNIVIGEADGHSHELVTMKSAGGLVYIEVDKREFTREQREKLAKDGLAMPDGSFPIVTKGDLRNAISAFGRAKNSAAVARHIVKRARALGATDLLPEKGVLANLIKAASGQEPMEVDPMAGEDTTKKAGDKEAAERVKALESELAITKKLVELNDEQRGFYSKLDGDEAKAKFLELSPDDRNAEIEKSRADDPIVYTADNGDEFRKSDDPRLVKMAKERDAERKELAAERALRKRDAYAKRATDELGNMPGEEGDKVELLKAVDSIPEAHRGKVLDLLKAGNTAMSGVFTKHGTSASGDVEASPEDQLEAMATEIAKRDGIDFHEAYVKACDTEEGGQLYAESQRRS